MNRIALIMHGGVAPPGSDRNVPAITGLVEHLSEHFDITVYSGFKPDGYAAPFMCGGAHVKHIPSWQGNSFTSFVPLAIRAFLKDHRSLRFSLVHGFWALPGGLAAVLGGKIAGIPSIVSLLGGEAASLPECGYGNMRSPVTRSLTLSTLRRAGDITALTAYQFDQLRRFGFKRTDGIHIIPFGADPELFPYVAQRPASPPYHLLHIGHLNCVKDQQTLLKAFRQISRQVDCDLRIIGEGSLDGQLRQLTGDLGIADRVTFAGFVPHHQLRDHFAWAHLLLHSSLYEGQAVVFSEAAASGVPVCGTRVGLLAEPGALFAVSVAPGDHNGLAERVCTLLKDSARMESLRCEARAWAAQHTALSSATRFAGLYSRLIAEQAAANEPSRERRRSVMSLRHAHIVAEGHLTTVGNQAGLFFPDAPEFACPSCHQLLTPERSGWRCEKEQMLFPIEGGIPNFLLPGRLEALTEFLTSYQHIRTAEGWGSAAAQYYRELPYRDLSGIHNRVWTIRARTFDRFLLHFSRQVGRRRVRCLDLGAGNCWFGARIAESGHSVVALDVNLDPRDGLGALSHFPPPQHSRIIPARADFDAIPFGPETFDVVVFNASLHYSSDVWRTLSGAMAVLKKQGVLYILDSPIYRSVEAGTQMIQERKQRFALLFGIATRYHYDGSFLTHLMLHEMATKYRTEVLLPGYGMRWALRPVIARVLGRREPASFMIVALHKE